MYVSVDETPEYVGYIKVKCNDVEIKECIAACDIHGRIWVYKINDKNEYILNLAQDKVEIDVKYGNVELFLVDDAYDYIRERFMLDLVREDSICPCLGRRFYENKITL